MQVRSFTGRSLKDAMNRAKAIFGENIVILDSTHLPVTEENPEMQIQLSVGVPDSAKPLQPPLWDKKAAFHRYLQTQLAEMGSSPSVPSTPHSDRLATDLSDSLISDIPEPYHSLFTKMVGLGFERNFTLDLVRSVYWSRRETGLTKGELLSILQPLFMKSLPEPDRGLFQRKSRMIIPVVGPTGSGKTTTIMKLALNPLCFGKRKVAILSLDHHRMAAGQQLVQFSKITGIPYTPIESEVELHQYFKSGVDAEIVLVDTPGRSPNFSDYTKELSEMLTLLQPTATILAMPLNYDTDDIFFNSVLYQALGTTHLFFTKLDETCRPGKLISVIHELNMPVAGLGNGQSITDDLILNYGEALWSRLILEI